MLILTNCLTDKEDEGCLKVANSLVKRMRNIRPEILIVSYERKSALTDVFLKLNKFMLNKSLISLLRKKNESVLYIPFPAKTIVTAVRVFLLSLFVKKDLDVICVLKYRLNWLAKLLWRVSRAKVVVFSKDSEIFYKDILGASRVRYLKTGIDTEKFKPVSKEEVLNLKKKYGFDENRPIILHVGHLKKGRNVGELLKFDNKYQVLLVTSTLTRDEQDDELRKQLLSKPNIRIIDEYVPSIQEIYQMSDLYFFPVKESGNCIDVPLSCMEAAACNKPILTTDYGEMKELIGNPGIFKIESFESETLNHQVNQVLGDCNLDIRTAVLPYDWNNAVRKFL